MSKTDQIRIKLDEIIAEMQATGAWEVAAPAPEAYTNMGAFGMNTMALEQWLRYVFIPSVQGRLASNGPWPPSSSVGTHAIRNFDGVNELARLTTLLCEFDHLF